MKVSSLLAQYLYEHKRLDLPGIGRFHIDDAVTVPEKDDRNFHEFLQYIQFSPAKVHEAETGLVEFIREKTGKIAPLAIADLETFISQGKELLNISKPFPIEGIGTLQQHRDGHLEFTAGDPDAGEHTGDKKQEKKESRAAAYESEFTRPGPRGNNLVTIFIILGILIGLGIIIGGGYYLYQRNTQARPAATVSQSDSLLTTADSLSNSDSSQVQAQADSSRTETAPAVESNHKAENAVAAAGEYKFVFETTHKRRAIPRFAQVHELSPRIQMETRDSVTYRIFVILPSNAGDTAWKKDSLKAWYWGTRPYGITIER